MNQVLCFKYLQPFNSSFEILVGAYLEQDQGFGIDKDLFFQALSECWEDLDKILDTDQERVGDNLSKENLNPIQESIQEPIFEPTLLKNGVSPFELIRCYQKALSLLLIVKENLELQKENLNSLQELVQKLMGANTWKEFQLASLYKCLFKYFLNLFFGANYNIQPPEITFLEGGSAPFESGNHWSWGLICHPCFHAELGSLLSLWGDLTSDELAKNEAKKIANWQINNLDAEYFPFVAMFTQEGSTTNKELLAFNAALFYSVARNCELTVIADKQMQALQSETIENKRSSLLPFILIKWFSKKHFVQSCSEKNSLPSSFQDSSLAIVGYRSSAVSSFATLFGGGTGMGAYQVADVKVINFGPQHLPLGECLGFGVEGFLPKYVKTAQTSDLGYTLEGISRITPFIDVSYQSIEPMATYRTGKSCTYYLNSCLKLVENELSISLQLQGIMKNMPLAFVFFVQAKNCVVNKDKTVHPRSFQSYIGKNGPIEFFGEKGKIQLNALDYEGELKVIPLGGGHNFWGADYLVAFDLNHKSTFILNP